MDSNKTGTKDSTQNQKELKAKSYESTCPPKNGALVRRGAGGSGRSPLIDIYRCDRALPCIILYICHVPTADICHILAADVCPVSTLDTRPVLTADVPFVARADILLVSAHNVD